MIPSASKGMVQLRLDLGGSAAPTAALWELAGSEQRRAAIVLLAALIARAVVGEGVCDDLAAVRDPGVLGGRDD
jgi:hypothetical protein